MKIDGKWLSGGDRITIELIRKLAEAHWKITIITGSLGKLLYSRYGLESIARIVDICPASYGDSTFGIMFYSLIALIRATWKAMVMANTSNQIVLSQSDFLPDIMPGHILKRRKRLRLWIATLYLFAPNPIRHKVYSGRMVLRGLAYYLAQKLSILLIKKNADMVLVTNDLDQRIMARPEREVVAIYGGVDFRDIPKFSQRKLDGPYKYDAVFVGRFHPQKGVSLLLNIWARVCRRRPNARLALIGVGPLESQLKDAAAVLGLTNNVDFLGFLDGSEKFRVFYESRLFVHPVIYDSGGMSAAEAMACGLPCIGFDLPALRSYYPRGMARVPAYDIEAFAQSILKLLDNEPMYDQLSAEAQSFAKEWDWHRRADLFLDTVERALARREAIDPLDKAS
jgi:glycosyltransferase involved in cell wall biosynthesis